MKIISIKWRDSPHDFIYILSQDDSAANDLRKLKAADTKQLFIFTIFAPDKLPDVLRYIKYDAHQFVS